ncbi:sensor histidine kinase [Pseudonocardia sp. GCM10023141]|uniref:sensor histidine kinase n=1 Tax=Pseudonocardia sp. GCM10023141 TaxID=3252653 RepID=UPI00362319F2
MAAGAAAAPPLRRMLRRIGIVSVLVTALATVAGGLALAQLSSARATVLDQLDPALSSAQTLGSAMLNQETGVRGYIATGARDFLDPYQRGRQQEVQAVADLRGFTVIPEVPQLASQLADVVARAQAWRVDYAEPSITAVTGDGARPRPVDEALGKSRFDAVRTALSNQLTGLRQARDLARSRVDAAANTLLVISIAIAVATVALLAVLALWARRAILAPIDALAAQVRSVAAGSFGSPVTGGGPRELFALAGDVDSMRAHILDELTTVQELNTRLDALNHELESQAAELERSNSDLEQFAYVASHDLQEPLRKVAGFCELLSRRYSGQLDERADQYIHFAVDGAQRMSGLINDLLAFSRVGRSSTVATWRAQSAEQLLDHAVRNLGATAAAAVTHGPLPTVTGEASLLTAVFQNLVGNAVKFHGDDPPRVRVSAERDGDSWTFRVSDNGIGIDPSYADRIFVIFQRLHPKDAYAGTGIGLALSRKIIEFHGGRMWLDVNTTAGTTFCFTLPASPSGVPQASEKEPAQR